MKDIAPFASRWTLDEALALVRELEQRFAKHGWHCAIAGGVMLRGESEHDLDVVVYPSSSPVGVDTDRLRTVLLGIGWQLRGRADYVQEQWRKRGSIDRKHVDIWATPDKKRVDIIVPTEKI